MPSVPRSRKAPALDPRNGEVVGKYADGTEARLGDVVRFVDELDGVEGVLTSGNLRRSGKQRVASGREYDVDIAVRLDEYSGDGEEWEVPGSNEVRTAYVVRRWYPGRVIEQLRLVRRGTLPLPFAPVVRPAWLKAGAEVLTTMFVEASKPWSDDNIARLRVVRVGGDEITFEVLEDGNEYPVRAGGQVRIPYRKACLEAAKGARGHFRRVEPKSGKALAWNRLVLPEEVKEAIETAIHAAANQKTMFEGWGFAEVLEKGKAVALLFHGVPGTGKTLAAEAIAEKLGRKLKMVASADLQGSDPGGFERRVAAAFEEAGKANAVLLFDECDSLIVERNATGFIIGAEVNALLTALERHDGVVIFTTNRLGRMDAAFQRRLSATIAFPFPTPELRARIWANLIPDKCPVDPKVKLADLAAFPLAGGHIKNVILGAARRAAFLKLRALTMECFEYALRLELTARADFERTAKEARLPGAARPASIGVVPGVSREFANGEAAA